MISTHSKGFSTAVDERSKKKKKKKASSSQNVDEALGGIINLFGWIRAARICVACHLLLVIVIGEEPRGPSGPALDITINIQRPADHNEKSTLDPTCTASKSTVHLLNYKPHCPRSLMWQGPWRGRGGGEWHSLSAGSRWRSKCMWKILCLVWNKSFCSCTTWGNKCSAFTWTDLKVHRGTYCMFWRYIPHLTCVAMASSVRDNYTVREIVYGLTARQCTVY